MRSTKLILTILFSLFTIITWAQSPERALKKLGTDPVYYMDSVKVDKSELMKYDPKDIALINVLKGKEAIDIIGEEGNHGVIYIETIRFAKSRYWKFFSSKSAEYKALVPVAGQDTTIQYILNDKVLDKNFEGNLAVIDDKIFKELIILSKEQLIEQYKIQDKDAGVLIKSDVPADLYHGKKKF
jgi:hypothetical protein